MFARVASWAARAASRPRLALQRGYATAHARHAYSGQAPRLASRYSLRRYSLRIQANLVHETVDTFAVRKRKGRTTSCYVWNWLTSSLGRLRVCVAVLVGGSIFALPARPALLKEQDKRDFKDQFNIGRKLGEGTYGTVFIVTDKVCLSYTSHAQLLFAWLSQSTLALQPLLVEWRSP